MTFISSAKTTIVSSAKTTIVTSTKTTVVSSAKTTIVRSTKTTIVSRIVIVIYRDFMCVQLTVVLEWLIYHDRDLS